MFSPRFEPPLSVCSDPVEAGKISGGIGGMQKGRDAWDGVYLLADLLRRNSLLYRPLSRSEAIDDGNRTPRGLSLVDNGSTLLAERDVMPQQRYADITLLLEGTYPFIRGGVSGWVHQILEAL